MMLAHYLLCALLFHTIFCRAVKMDANTLPGIRFALLTLGTVAAAGLAVPLHWPSWQPDPYGLAVLGAVVLVQVVTAYHWRDGVPDRFQRKTTP